MITGEKTPAELDAMRQGGKIMAQLFAELRERVKPGVTEKEIDAWVTEQIAARGAIATYRTDEVKFPASICISTNDKIVHSIPTDRAFEDGDVVGFDLVITYKGMKVDAAFTMIVGNDGDPNKKRLVDMTERSLYAGIDAIKGPVKTGDIGAAVEKVLKSANLGIVRELVGHGIGHKMHQEPDIPNYGHAGTGVQLVPGDTVAIEPMAMLGQEQIYLDGDRWTIRTRDNSIAAHFEHTILITEHGAEILTAL
jgi:methionyl aminopeptidase